MNSPARNIARLALLGALLPFSSGLLAAQATDTLPAAVPDGQVIESIIEQSESEEFDDDTFLEDLLLRRNDKININEATWADLEALGVLTDIQIRNIIYYRERFGRFMSPWELLGVETLGEAEARALAGYFLFGDEKEPPRPLGDMFRQGKHQVFLRYQQTVEQKRGFTPPDTLSDGSLSSRYLGLAPRLYARYRFTYGTDLSLGVTAEQDPGEPFRHPAQKTGVDYLSGHFFLKDRGPLSRLVLGDYEVHLGQGLFLSHSYGAGKSPAVNQVRKRNIPFKPHTSANEAEYFTGAAAEFALAPQWKVMVFGSYRKIDGNVLLADDSLDVPAEVTAFTSIQTSGYHRTESELADKGAIGQGSAGGSLSWTGRKLRVTANASYMKFSVPLERAEALYNQFDFRGDRLIHGGLDYQFLHRNVSLFGEAAVSDNGGWGMLNGANFQLPASVRLSLVHRYYAKDFQTLYANAFGEGSRPVNEHGLYIGLSISPFRNAEWSHYVDFYKHPWLRFGIDGPSHGIDALSLFTWQPKRNLRLQVRGRYERKLENAPDNETAADYLVPTAKSSFRFHLDYRPTDRLSLRSRLEGAWYNDGVNETARGFLVYQDVNYSFQRAPLALYARYALFQTDTYDARIYAYESDLLYVFSVPAYYGRGSRYYLMLKVDAGRHLDFWVRWSQTFWTDRTTVSSGLEELDGNTRSEVKVQMRVRF